MQHRERYVPKSTFFRTGHGGSKDQLVAVENTVPDELPSIDPTARDPATDRKQRDQNGRFTPGNTVARGPRLRHSRGGSLENPKATKAYKMHHAWGKTYASRRRAELRRATGNEISLGVCALIENEAVCMANARLLEHDASEMKDPKERATMLKFAAQMKNEARQQAQAAYSLAVKETEWRPKQDAHAILIDALVTDVTPQLPAKRGPGRPRKTPLATSTTLSPSPYYQQPTLDNPMEGDDACDANREADDQPTNEGKADGVREELDRE